jgi:hypothetical protein
VVRAGRQPIIRRFIFRRRGILRHEGKTLCLPTWFPADCRSPSVGALTCNSLTKAGMSCQVSPPGTIGLRLCYWRQKQGSIRCIR